MRRSVRFGHERLEVYERALEFAVLADAFAPSFVGVRRNLGWQLNKAAASILLNIAEGNGRYRPLDKAHFFVVAAGSAMECSAVLDIAERIGVGEPEELQEMRSALESVNGMLIGLAKAVRSRQSE